MDFGFQSIELENEYLMFDQILDVIVYEKATPPAERGVGSYSKQ